MINRRNLWFQIIFSTMITGVTNRHGWSQAYCLKLSSIKYIENKKMNT